MERRLQVNKKKKLFLEGFLQFYIFTLNTDKSKKLINFIKVFYSFMNTLNKN